MDIFSAFATISFYVEEDGRPLLLTQYTGKIPLDRSLRDALKIAYHKGFKFLRNDPSIDSSVKISWVSVEFDKYLGSENEVK